MSEAVSPKQMRRKRHVVPPSSNTMKVRGRANSACIMKRVKFAAKDAKRCPNERKAENEALIAQALAEGRVTRCPPQTYARPDL
ncbi:MAG: hypothetical protein AAFO61_04900 [Pseudomonadota bacterium]